VVCGPAAGDVGRLVSSLMMTSSQTLMRGNRTPERFAQVAGTLRHLVFDGLAR
jgi:hypothetical protein